MYGTGINYGAVGRDPKATAHAISYLADAADSITDDASMAQWCRDAKRCYKKLAQSSTAVLFHNSLVGGQPTRFLGIDSLGDIAAGIAAGATQAVTGSPQIAVRPVHFRTDSAFSADFVITGIRLATLDMVVGEDAMPATAFDDGVALPAVDAPRISSGSPARVTVVNRSGALRRFVAVLHVLPLEGPGSCE